MCSDWLSRFSSSSEQGSSSTTSSVFELNGDELVMWLTVGKWSVYLTGQLKKWMTEMSGDILAVWIEAFRPMELSQSGVRTGIP
jgi:hypothetical protein